jgi:hypothetical protein
MTIDLLLAAVLVLVLVALGLVLVDAPSLVALWWSP